MKKRNRPFQLLEVMIAMFLVALCALPLIQPHVYMFEQEQKAIRLLEVDHAASLVYADIVETLYENKIDWDQIVDKSVRHPINSPELTNLGYEGYYTFDKLLSKPPEEPPEETNYLMNVSLVLNPRGESRISKLYEYLVFIKRKIKQGEDTTPKKEDEKNKKK